MILDYRHRINTRIEELKSAPGFTLRASELAEPSLKSVETVRTAVRHLPTGVEEFYTQLGGFDLEWEYADPHGDGNATDFGAIRILPIEQVFSDGLGTVWFDDFEGGDRFKDVKPFDVFAAEACAAFLWEPETAPKDTVHYHYFGEATKPLDLTFTEYMERALSSCGYENWHAALDPHISTAQKTLNRMQAIIPGFLGTGFGSPH